MSLTVVLTNFMRPDNLRRVIDSLCKQTVRCTLFLWDNSPSQDFNDRRVDWIIKSSRNARCAPRWWMARHSGTDFVLIHDDDLMSTDPKSLAWTLEATEKNAPFAVGIGGVILNSDREYWRSKHLGVRADKIIADTCVDVVKGFYFCCPTEGLTAVSHLELDEEDDIAVSARLGNGLKVPHLLLAKLQDRFVLLPEGKVTRKRRANHRVARDTACKSYFERL